MKYYYMYLPRGNNKARKVFKHYNNEVENQLGKTIKVIHIDWGEYGALEKFYSKMGIILQTTTHLNPIVECLNFSKQISISSNLKIEFMFK